MRCSNLFTIFALAMTATAVPAVENVDNVLAGRANQCSNQGHTIVCCNPAGNNCSPGSSCSRPFKLYCCKKNAVNPPEGCTPIT